MMDVGDSLQAAEVVVGALSLLIASVSAYLTWQTAMVGRCPEIKSTKGFANNLS
jgi:hypothetical protein